MTLPVQAILPALKTALQEGRNAVLQAPPGAGKTTLVPLELLEEKWLKHRKIILLQPRRLATRAAARRMAALLKEAVGQRVGYRIRFDSRVGKNTRIEVVTEALLTRKLQNDPELSDTGLVIFDEFHERSIHSDLGLALCREVQTELRTDLRILVMSATLEGNAIARIIDGEVITGQGRQYPVETRYLGKPVPKKGAAWVAAEINKILAQEAGSLLVFLPGAGEIRRVKSYLEKTHARSDLIIAPLYGNLPGKMQDLAIKPCKADQRKVVLSTSIAETSLTIEGIHVVVDAGRMRIPRFNPGSLMTVLETVRVSRASADQRRGRAGRTGPGICLRLWTEHDHLSLVPFNKPEIMNTDLSPLALELACWGTTRPGEMAWLDPPPDAAMEHAYEFLLAIGAVDSRRNVTRHGRDINALGIHPRLGHMILKGAAAGAGRLAADMAALISGRDILQGTNLAHDVDIRVRLEALRKPGMGQADIDRRVISRTAQLSDRWQKMAGKSAVDSVSLEGAGKILALAYPDRIGKVRAGSRNRYLLSGGRGAILPEHDALCGTPFIVVARTDGKPDNARIYLAAPVAVEMLEESLNDRLTVQDAITWNRRTKSVECRRQLLIGKVALRDSKLKNPDIKRVYECLFKGVREAGMECLHLTREDRKWVSRMQFIRSNSREHGKWPDLSDRALMQNLEAWLQPHVAGLRSLAALKKLNMKKILGALLTWEQRSLSDRLAPKTLRMPSGSNIGLDYAADKTPVLAVRLQEVFGLRETPTVLDGEIKVILHLLSPAGRSVQVTRDLEGFWKGVYSDVRKEMRGRYPKHYWPDDPLKAVPTNRVKPRRK
jgi:ATP-dependent helicase HrpB